MPGDGLQILILAPSQELAIQTRDVLTPYAHDINVAVQGIIGSANVKRQLTKLKEKPEVIVATAGRLLELIQSHKLKLDGLQTLVVDEADEMLRIRDSIRFAKLRLRLRLMPNLLSFRRHRVRILARCINGLARRLSWLMFVRLIKHAGRFGTYSCKRIGHIKLIGCERWRTLMASRHWCFLIKMHRWNARPAFAPPSCSFCRIVTGGPTD